MVSKPYQLMPAMRTGLLASRIWLPLVCQNPAPTVPPLVHPWEVATGSAVLAAEMFPATSLALTVKL